jgi:hypothetical protein
VVWTLWVWLGALSGITKDFLFTRSIVPITPGKRHIPWSVFVHAQLTPTNHVKLEMTSYLMCSLRKAGGKELIILVLVLDKTTSLTYDDKLS